MSFWACCLLLVAGYARASWVQVLEYQQSEQLCSVDDLRLERWASLDTCVDFTIQKCNSSHHITTFHTDANCQNPVKEIAEPLECHSVAGRAIKIVCNAQPGIITETGFFDNDRCSGEPLLLFEQAFGGTCTRFSSFSNFTENNGTWTDGSFQLELSSAEINFQWFDNLECSGSPLNETTLGRENCTKTVLRIGGIEQTAYSKIQFQDEVDSASYFRPSLFFFVLSSAAWLL